MQIFLLLSLAVAIIAVIFTVQNTTVTQISFLLWSFEGSLALMLLIALALGALFSFFASLPTLIRRDNMIRSQKKRISEAESLLIENKLKLETVQKKLETYEPPEKIADQPKQEAGGRNLWQG
jgi:lipopolysaccharide assembly protein A